MKQWIAVLTLSLSTSAMAGDLTYHLRVDGLACAYCAYGIEKAFMGEPGVTHVDVDFDSGVVLVESRGDVDFTDEQLREIMNDSGFTLRGVERIRTDGS